MATNNKNFKVKNGLDVGGNAAITGDANVAGKLSVTARSGDEGGEIFLSNAATNTTITNGVTIDVWQNRLRFFEQGGDARGYYIDITGGGNAATTNLVGGGSASDSFRTISANGTSVVADSSTDTLTITPGDNVQIAGNATSDTITFTVNGALTNITSIITPNYITFDTTPTGVSSNAGTMYWDSGDGIPKVVLNANVSIGMGQESILLVKNATGSTLTKGSVIYINGAQGQNPTVALADADTEATSSKTFGFVAEQILDTAEGYVVTEGILRGVNTLGFTEGGAIWLSSTAGGYTQTIPDEPAHSVFLGYAVKAHETAGEIIVKIQNGYELTELHGVTISNTAATNDILQLNSSGIWVNANLATANIANLSATGTQTFSGNIAGTNISVSGNISATTFFGNIAIGNVTGLGTNVATFLGTPNSLNFLNTITDETGTGNVVFSTSPVLVTPNIGAAVGTSVNVTGQLISTVVTGTAPLSVASTTEVANLKAASANNASNAAAVNVVTNVTNATFYPVFVDSDNASSTPEAIYSDAGLSFNPSTNNLTTTTFTGNLSATTATVSGTINANAITVAQQKNALVVSGYNSASGNFAQNSRVIMTGTATGSSDPTTRPDGTALQAGDVWIDW